MISVFDDVFITEVRHEYEDAVRGLSSRAANMRAAGKSSETIARDVHAKRRCLAAVFKDRTPEPYRSKIYARTIAIYGDPIGPTIEWLRKSGKSWDDIVASATRPGDMPYDSKS